jgi:DNA (cytosine-5)-methyltransferase 1
MIPAGGCARAIAPEKLNGLSRRYDSAYRRLHPDAPSTALSTRYDCVYHYRDHRSLSVREYARLQGIPDFVEFPETAACRRHAYEMIGNSVPPFLIYGVLSQIAAARRGAG